MKNRYKRNIGTLTIEENEKLKDFKVCVIGCGGLGGYIIEMLSRIGIGYITVVDGDIFDESNLNRQLFSDENNLGLSKVQIAKKRTETVNHNIYINPVNKFLNNKNSKEILKNHDIAIDALDNIKVRFVLQDTCKELNIPLIHGAISGWYGQVTTIFPGDDTLNYIYKNKETEIENKLGNPSFTPANIASIQVCEAIKVLLNKGEVLSKKLLLIDLLYNENTTIEI
ncbi:HesA/MoeB/ThiF family protein [Romboutsia sp.]|uniref:HesA/MoeB/ThiF family protein n=1 Tax=Romboutsia sp. TaxID=1965302 RepID=UPI002D0D2BF6|nr:HesA/MoeB/ThiF family protein [Romboutsia sp.]HSQ88733.1 HesA/MoeB/ThiF family protein [Romboutsia sp.]